MMIYVFNLRDKIITTEHSIVYIKNHCRLDAWKYIVSDRIINLFAMAQFLLTLGVCQKSSNRFLMQHVITVPAFTAVLCMLRSFHSTAISVNVFRGKSNIVSNFCFFEINKRVTEINKRRLLFYIIWWKDEATCIHTNIHTHTHTHTQAICLSDCFCMAEPAYRCFYI